MRRRLWLANLILLALIVVMAVQLRDNWYRARAHEQEVLGRIIPAKPGAPPALEPRPGNLNALNYIAVAQQILFSRDRNPTPIPPPPPPPPAPPKEPLLPIAYGIMMIGDPLVMLSEKQGAPQRSYRVGDSVGEFKIAAIAPNFLELDWQGQKRGYALEDLRSKAAPPPDSGPAPVAAPVAQQQSAVSSLGAKAEGPGINVSPTMKACIPGDTAPEGTVAGGYKKMNTATPFGNQCRWEKVN